MNKNLSDLDKKKILIVLGIVIIIILVVLIILNQRVSKSQTKIEGAITVVTPEETPKNSSPEIKDQFQVAMPVGVKVPEPNAVLSEEEKKEIAVPTISVPAGPGVIANFRSFNIKAENNLFTPSKIIVNLGDTVNIKFTAVDKDYDIIFKSYNMKQTALKGETKTLEFQAVQAGAYIYYCQKCGGVNSQTKGEIIIIKK